MTSVISRTRHLSVAGGAVILLALLLAVPAFACSPQAQITTRPARGEAGALVDVNGNTFDEGVVRIWFDGPSGTPLAELRAASDGTFVQQVRIPYGAQPGPHSIVATIWSESARRFFTAPTSFVVEGAAAPSPPPPQNAPPLESGRPAPSPAPSARTGGAPGGAPGASPAGAAAPQAPATASVAPGQPGLIDGAQVSPGAAAGAPGPVLAPTNPLPPREESGLVQPTTEGPAPRAQRSVDVGGLSPWLLLPLGLIGATLLSLSGASFVHELRQQRKAEVEA